VYTTVDSYYSTTTYTNEETPVYPVPTYTTVDTYYSTSTCTDDESSVYTTVDAYYSTTTCTDEAPVYTDAAIPEYTTPTYTDAYTPPSYPDTTFSYTTSSVVVKPTSNGTYTPPIPEAEGAAGTTAVPSLMAITLFVSWLISATLRQL